MGAPYRERSPHPLRLGRLLAQERRAAAGQERLPELLPAICPDCRVVLGLVIPGGAILCRDCGVWAEAMEDVIMLGMPV